jgi:hypothetical protein
LSQVSFDDVKAAIIARRWNQVRRKWSAALYLCGLGRRRDAGASALHGGINSPAEGSGVTIRIRYRILNARLAAGAVSGGGVDQAYDGWWVVSEFEFQRWVGSGHSLLISARCKWLILLSRHPAAHRGTAVAARCGARVKHSFVMRHGQLTDAFGRRSDANNNGKSGSGNPHYWSCPLMAPAGNAVVWTLT